ncbi:uncharacterized protein EV154DRAFT_506942 [Mucor mucedo]|uniref:uncharacterized protein n=1 Tax=Mucor mucedo TaxID=29922 RepID=UPI00221F5B61|nr:uncharacterized protein EV154DRAFT_506942 [Mucor mucedo]KAI7891703.1 hypothetical protein EV154DRAFT_506942 [Mucor mucedo]
MNVNILCRRFALGSQQVRRISTEYVPGRKGYAPGFQAPEGSRESIKVVHKRREIGSSLTSHLPGSGHSQNVTEKGAMSAQKLYRQELKETRHKYARELLEKQGQKELKSAEKLAATQQKLERSLAELEEAKQQQREHEREVVEMLTLENDTQSLDTEDRTHQRTQNRLAMEKAQREIRRKQLLKLYATTQDFVTLDNLDAKVDAIISTEGRSFHESLSELMNNTNSVQSEIEQRKAQLKEVMGL